MFIWDRVAGLFSIDMGIDLGTANTLVCVPGSGVVLSEPSVVAVSRDTNRVLLGGQAVGSVAKEMLGKTPGGIRAIRPLKEGVIADFDITEAMIRYFILKVHKRRWGVCPRVVIAVPSGITGVERRAVIDSAERAGARRVYLINEPRAAAIGVGLPLHEPVASLIIDVGGGTTEVAVLSLFEEVTATTIRVAGDSFDEAIMNYLKKTYNLMIGEQTSERIKIQIGSAYPLEQEMTMDVKGRDQVAGLPRKITISSEEIREAIRDPIEAIIAAVKNTLEKTDPELSADLVDRGMVMCGGGSLLRGLDKVLARETGLAVRVAAEPLLAVAKGTGAVLENLDILKDHLASDENT